MSTQPEEASSPDPPSPRPLRPLIHWWHQTPLYWRIIAALVLGVLFGVLLGPLAPRLGLSAKITEPLLSFFATFSRLILRLLGALAPPLIMIAVLQALMQAQLKGGIAGKMIFLLILNTVVAILIGLLVANVIRPGRHASLKPKEPEKLSDRATDPREKEILQTLEKYNFKQVPDTKKDPLSQFLDNIPESLLRPLVDNNVIGVIFVAVAFGIALRRSGSRNIATAGDLVALAFDSILIVLHWIIDLVPFGVFGIVAKIVGTEGFAPFKSLAWFVVAVLLGLLLQACYYLIRIRLGSWVRPMQLLRGTRDALVMAFSTGSSTATMPVTFDRLWRRVGLREESASMGALVGSNFNNDGTALYEAMSALFISQLIGHELGITQQLIVILTSVIASVGAAGIPEAGLVTMTLVFSAVGLPVEYIAILLTVDWFLDRSRTMINVMGDMNVSCLLDGKVPATSDAQSPAQHSEVAMVASAAPAE